MDHIRNKDIRKEAHINPVETNLENKILKWFGNCLRRERNHICAKSLILEFLGEGADADRKRDGETTYRERWTHTN